MEKNDQEIDGMIEVAIGKLERLGFHAQDIHSNVDQQAKRLKQVQANVDKAWSNLEKRNGEMASLLENYRKMGTCCKDLGLFLCLLILVGCNVAVLKWKGVIN